VEKSLAGDATPAEPGAEESTFDLEKVLGEEVSLHAAAGAVTTPAPAGEFDKTKEIMEQTLAELDLPTVPPEAVSPKPPSKNLAAVLILVLVVGAGVAAGYIFSAKEPQTVPAKKIFSSAPDSATPPAMAKPLVPQTHEMPATVESKPSALPVPSAAEPVKEPAAAEAVQPAKQEPAPPAAEPIKTASEQPPAAAPVSPPPEPVKEPAAAEAVQPAKQEPEPPAAEPIKTASKQPRIAAPVTPPAQPPAAEQKDAEPPQKALEQPKMTKAAVAGFYCVNVGSFKLQDSTDRACRDLRNKGYEPIAETVTLSDGNTWYRVTVGNFATRDEAAQFGRELASKTKIKPMVVKRKH
jgi:cell division protein FtsN